MIDGELRKILQHSIENAIEVFKNNEYDSILPRAKRKWKFDNDREWLYGYMIGSLESTCYWAFRMKTNEDPTEEEQLELNEILEVYAKDIRGMLSKF